MIRKQVYIEERQEKLLKKKAKRLGVPEAQLIRESIDQSILTTTGRRLDPKIWSAEKRFIAKLKKKPVSRKRRPWSRGELHDR